MNKTILLNHSEIEKKINRIALQILETNFDCKQLILIGILDRGLILADKISNALKLIEPEISIQTLSLAIDKKKSLNGTAVLSPFIDLNNKSCIVIDDVLNSGITLMGALSFISSHQPCKIQTVILANRDHSNFPIKADFVGISLATTLQEHIWFEIVNDKMEVYLT